MCIHIRHIINHHNRKKSHLHKLTICFRIYGAELYSQSDHNKGPYPQPTTRQPTLWLHKLCLEILIVHSNELRLSKAKTFYSTHTIMSRIWHSIGTTFKGFSYDAVLAEHRTHHLPNTERMRYMLATDAKK